MTNLKKYPKCEHLEWLDNDATGDSSFGDQDYYTSMDIIKIFPEIKMDALQEWFRKEFVRPIRATEGPRNKSWIKLFNRSGLCMIAVFKRLVDFGVNREHARAHMRAFHNLRIGYVKKHGKEPNFILFEIENVHASLITIIDKFKLNKKMVDCAVINFYEILRKIDAYEKG